MVIVRLRFGVACSLPVLKSHVLLTLRSLGVYEFLYQRIRSLGVETESVSQRLKIWALLQEILLQAISSCVEVLLKGKRKPYKQYWKYRLPTEIAKLKNSTLLSR